MQELASAIGISYQSLYDCLKGNPTLKRLHEIANALGVDVRELFEQQQDSFACPHCGKPIKVTAE